VLEVKYQGKQFAVMPDEERWLVAKVLLLKIHAITGWTLPVSEMMTIFIDQMQKKMQESYRNVTAEEIEYAFRNRGLDIKDWGKELNLTMIDEIMLPYLTTRSELSKFEEHLKNKPPEIEEKKQLSDEEWEEWMVDIKDYRVDLIPVQCYDYLLRSEKINPTGAQKNEAMNRALTMYGISIQDNLRDWDEFMKQKEQNKISGKHYDSLVVIAKRLIVYDYLQTNVKE